MAEILPACLSIPNQSYQDRRYVCFSAPDTFSKLYYVSVHALVGMRWSVLLGRIHESLSTSSSAFFLPPMLSYSGSNIQIQSQGKFPHFLMAHPLPSYQHSKDT
jgi:hypothetical protein